MPIDTSIYRNQAPPPSPMESMGHLLGLKAAIQQQQAGALQLEQQKRAVSDDAAARQLFAGGGDVTDDQILSTLGPVHGGAILKVRREQQRAELDRSISELTLNGTRAKLGGQILAGVKDQASYQAALPVIAQILGPDAAKHFGPQYDPAMVQQFVNSGLSTEAQLEEKRKQAEDQRKAIEFGWKQTAQPFQQAETVAKATTAQQVAAGTQPVTPYQQQQLKATTETQKRLDAQAAETRRHNQATETRMAEIAAARNQTPGDGSGLVGEEHLKTLAPARQQMIRAMASGAIPAPSPNSRSNEAQRNLSDLLAFDPTFTTQRAQVRKAFATGPDGKNIGALNTAIVHLGRMGEAGDALQNGTFVPGNEAYNWLKDRFGSDKVTNFGLLKDAVAGEMAAALKGNATDIEIEKMGKSIRSANSPAQMKGVIQEGMAVLNDKARTYQERYQQSVPGDSWSPILPSARAMLDKHGVKKTGAVGLAGVSTDELLRRLAK